MVAMRRWGYAVGGAVTFAVAAGLYLSFRSLPTESSPAQGEATGTPEAPSDQPPPPVSIVASPVEPSHVKNQDDALLLQKIRENLTRDPALAVDLAYQARRSFPNSARAEERDALLIDGLINLQKIGAARDEAERYLERYPNGRYAPYIFAMTGASPRPQGPPGR